MKMQEDEVVEQKHRNGFEAAKKYLRWGFCVIPLNGKSPACQWKEYQNRRSTLGEITHWFGAASRHDYNVGIVTGSSDLTVVDADGRPDGLWFWKEIATTPFVVRTGRKPEGYHFYFRQGNTGDRIRVFGRKIDIRSVGVIVAPPSIHPTTGRPYEFIDGTCISIEDMPRFDPEWLPERSGSMNPVVSGDNSPDVIRRARSYISRIMSVEHEGGDKDLFRTACVLTQKFNLSEEIALNELRAWNQTNSFPPWPDERLRYKISQALRNKT